MPALARPAALPARPRIVSPEPRLGRYALAQHLASGRWFDVYRARPVEDSYRAACYVLKTIRPSAVDWDLARSLLRREAALAAQVTHPNLIPLLDADLDGEQPYAVFPFLEGVTLAGCSGLISVPQALWYSRQVAAALDTLHAAGWLHGDVKPSNIMISPQGHATLIDLGLARRLGTSECRSGQLLAGDLRYAAQENLIPGRELTAQADVYSLGVTLLMVLAGREFTSEQEAKYSPREQIAQLRATRPDVSREVALLLTHMTATEPLRRPTAGELVERLTRLEIESLMQW